MILVPAIPFYIVMAIGYFSFTIRLPAASDNKKEKG
jgi:hypothetical protein